MSDLDNKKEGWKTPRQEPVNGIVQPRLTPPPGKPCKHTNVLDFILHHVLKDAMKHKHAWPFLKPVDALSLNITHYHQIIERPMDLKTIEGRIRNVYYVDSKDCIRDIETVFKNCYKFNGSEDDITIMAKNVEKVIKDGIEAAPSNEEEMEPTWNKSKKAKEKSKSEKKNRMPRLNSEAPSESGSEVSGISTMSSKKAVPKTAVKRKADSISSDTSAKASKREKELSPEDIKPTKAELAKKKMPEDKEKKAPPPPTLPSKKPPVQLTGKMRLCGRLLTDFFGKKHKDYAFIFYEPVDPVQFNLPDYHTIIKRPMDMSTIKKKLEAGEYCTPKDFADDFRLMIDNCLTYNPPQDAVHHMGKRMKSQFEQAFKETFGESGDDDEKKPQIKIPVENEELTLQSTIHQLNSRKNALEECVKKMEITKEKLEAAMKSRKENGSAATFPSSLVEQARELCETFEVKPTIKKKKKLRHDFYEFDSDDEDAKKEMSYDEKRELSILINKLPQRYLMIIIKIMEHRETLGTRNQQNEVEVDFTLAKPVTLRELETFCRAVMRVNGISGKPAGHTGDESFEGTLTRETPSLAPVSTPSTTTSSSTLANTPNTVSKPANSLNGNGPTQSAAVTGGAAQKKPDMSDSSDEDDEDNDNDNNSSDSSDSSDDEEEVPQNRKGGMPPSSQIGRPFGPMSARKPNSNGPVAPYPGRMEKPSMKQPDYQRNLNKGATSILDTLLPDPVEIKNPRNNYNSRAQESSEDEQQRIARLREEERRRRNMEEENVPHVVSQQEVMNNFERSIYN